MGVKKPISLSPLPDYRRTVTPRIGSLENAHYKPGHLHTPCKLNWGKDEVMWPQYELGRTSRNLNRTLMSRNSAQTVP